MGEGVPGVLWAYQTTFQIPTNESPFNLAFGIEAIIPMEIGQPCGLSTMMSQATQAD